MDGAGFILCAIVASVCAGLLTTPITEKRPALSAILQLVGCAAIVSGAVFYGLMAFPTLSKVRLTLIVVAFVLQGVALWLLYLFSWDVVTRHKFVTVSVGFVTHAVSIVLLALIQYV